MIDVTPLCRLLNNDAPCKAMFNFSQRGFLGSRGVIKSWANVAVEKSPRDRCQQVMQNPKKRAESAA